MDYMTFFGSLSREIMLLSQHFIPKLALVAQEGAGTWIAV
jgi:hypothetical protein